MMRFPNYFDRMVKIRNMGFSLQFFVTVEMIIAALAFYSMHGQIDDTIYIPWFAVLTLSIFPMALCTALNFARYRVVCRISHMIAIVGVYHKYDFVMVPPACAVYFSAELGYLIAGVGTKQMEWPGKWMAQITDKWQDVDEQSDKDRLPLPFTSIANEVVRKDCTIEEEYIDDLFEYHTAYEEDMFPDAFNAKPRGTFIV
ncbi:unnamed protein product [Caenorhabditis sp. 36 PRJEB53466]|nr:unnamed protein product [Caenorhabditis sp. 36 PRJEB53466]